jgi:Fic family protein
MRTRYVDIDDRMEDLADRMRGDPEIASEFLLKYELSWLYHENALEGVVYTPQELSAAMANQPVADATFVSALQGIRNHKLALELIREESKAKKPRLNLALVKQLYEMLGTGAGGKPTPAEFRKDMPIHRAYFHEIATPAKIPAQLEKVFEYAESPEFRNVHIVQAATRFHHGFMQVFPYTENSGRIARLLVNLLLLREGYPLLCIVHSTDRQRYYDSLRFPEATLRDLTLEALDNALLQAEKYFAETRTRRRKTAQ